MTPEELLQKEAEEISKIKFPLSSVPGDENRAFRLNWNDAQLSKRTLFEQGYIEGRKYSSLPDKMSKDSTIASVEYADSIKGKPTSFAEIWNAAVEWHRKYSSPEQEKLKQYCLLEEQYRTQGQFAYNGHPCVHGHFDDDWNAMRVLDKLRKEALALLPAPPSQQSVNPQK